VPLPEDLGIGATLDIFHAAGTWPEQIERLNRISMADKLHCQGIEDHAVGQRS